MMAQQAAMQQKTAAAAAVQQKQQAPAPSQPPQAQQSAAQPAQPQEVRVVRALREGVGQQDLESWQVLSRSFMPGAPQGGGWLFGPTEPRCSRACWPLVLYY